MRICQICKLEKDDIHFTKNKAYKDGVNRKCKECAKIAITIWRDKNKDHVKQYAKTRRQMYPEKIKGYMDSWREENREWIREYSRVYRDRNLEKVSKSNLDWHYNNRARSLNNSRRWKENNPDKVKMHDHLKRARRNNAPGYCSDRQWAARFNYHGRKCRYCEKPLDESTVQIEHMVPLARGGTNWPANLVPSCRWCNTSKKDKTYFEYRLFQEKRKIDLNTKASQLGGFVIGTNSFMVALQALIAALPASS